ncbi:MAG: methyltransferase domain-containing protein [Omnitrophica bacterium]|nr:methyltransferase domain-containing protein [Candidatus Omnitrophota bacterium]
MKNSDHYDKTVKFFRASAIERQGYYDAKPQGALEHNIWQMRIRKIVLELLDELSPDPDISKVIDVGCGRGDFTIEIAKRYRRFSEVWGSDFSKETLEIAQRNGAALEKVFFREANLLNMPFKEKSFGLCLCINTMHHIHKNDISKSLSELARITDKYIVLEVKNNDNLYMRYVRSKALGGINVYPTSVKEVSGVLKKYGFRLVRQKGIFLFNWLSPLLVLVYKA